MKVVQLRVENFMRLRAIEVTPDPDGSLVIVAGKNAQGKTSLLNAIAAALGGAPMQKGIDRAIRDGQDHARVEVDLGEFIVTREWTANDRGKVTVRSHDGSSWPSPQQFLDERLGALSFDPLAFANMAPKDQRETLLGVVDVDYSPFASLADFEAKRLGVYEERTIVGREVKRLEGALKQVARPPEDLPAPVDPAELMEELRRANGMNMARREGERTLELRRSLIAELRQRLGEAELQERQELAYLDSLPPEIDLAPIDERMRTLSAENEKRRVQQKAAEAYAALDAKRAEQEELTEKLKKGDAWKDERLAAAEMPVEGLGFDDEGVTYRGVPLSQASGAERLRVSVAVGLALNPEIRVLLVRDGSLLDADNLALLGQLAEEHDAQLWVERVEEDEAVGFVIEDGEVKS